MGQGGELVRAIRSIGEGESVFDSAVKSRFGWPERDPSFSAERPARQRPCGLNAWWGIYLPSRQEVDDGSSATVAGRGQRSQRGQPGRARHPATRDRARLGGRAAVAAFLPGGVVGRGRCGAAEERRAERAANPHGPSLPSQLAEQLIHFFALMLWVAAGLAFVGGMPALGAAIVVVIVVNGAFSFFQGTGPSGRCARCQRCSRRRSSCAEPAASERCRPPRLVPGDVVLLKEGDRISADARVIRSSELRVDMSTLTGESEPVSAARATRPRRWTRSRPPTSCSRAPSSCRARARPSSSRQGRDPPRWHLDADRSDRQASDTAASSSSTARSG